MTDGAQSLLHLIQPLLGILLRLITNISSTIFRVIDSRLQTTGDIAWVLLDFTLALLAVECVLAAEVLEGLSGLVL